MPCEFCRYDCDAPDCGYEPVYGECWTDCGTEYTADCEGFEAKGRERPIIECRDLPCDLCKEFRALSRFVEWMIFFRGKAWDWKLHGGA